MTSLLSTLTNPRILHAHCCIANSAANDELASQAAVFHEFFVHSTIRLHSYAEYAVI